ncbi:hypothetical protein PIROE2DRAFT_12139 [Piromyces sp. E2]|nr:hypothetical protein PIROE2DRAFT_12139 [Piromyces sp. E2]|eukprot:OUM61782.1 hypothetical protein PIROE2DRAFT_12139 [Piromyces sp. E2]
MLRCENNKVKRLNHLMASDFRNCQGKLQRTKEKLQRTKEELKKFKENKEYQSFIVNSNGKNIFEASHGVGRVEVITNVQQKLECKSLTFDSNGTIIIKPTPDGYYVIVNINAPFTIENSKTVNIDTCTCETKTITPSTGK